MSIKEDSSNWYSSHTGNELDITELATTTEYDIVHEKQKSTTEKQLFVIYFSKELYELMVAKRFSKGIIQLKYPGGLPLQSRFDKGWVKATHKIGNATECYAREISVHADSGKIATAASLLHDAVSNFMHDE